MTRRIEDLRGPPKVGVMYDVPTLSGRPIIPAAHKDDNVDRLHVHYDMRFIADQEHREIGCLPHEIMVDIIQREHNWAETLPLSDQQVRCTSCGETRKIADMHLAEPCNSNLCHSGFVLLVDSGSYFPRSVRECMRELRSPIIPLSGAISTAVKPICKNGRKFCPHRGADVTHLQPNKLGQARCPLHGQLLDLTHDWRAW